MNQTNIHPIGGRQSIALKIRSKSSIGVSRQAGIAIVKISGPLSSAVVRQCRVLLRELGENFALLDLRHVTAVTSHGLNSILNGLRQIHERGYTAVVSSQPGHILRQVCFDRGITVHRDELDALWDVTNGRMTGDGFGG